MNDAFIIDAIRTPIGKFAGSLSGIRADDLAAITIGEIIKRNSGLGPDAIDDVMLGCANQAGEDNRNVARMALLLAGLPHSVPGITVNRLCASGLAAATYAAQSIQTGAGDLYITGGTEHMTRAPFVLSKSESPFSRSAELFDTSIGWRFVNPKMNQMYGIDSMGHTAENVAEMFSIPRNDQDRFALRSQQKAAEAQKSGRLAQEIVAVEIPQKKAAPILFKDDEFIRAGTTIEALAKLRPVFRRDEKGTVTAGNSSGINDGSCALLMASKSAVSRFGLKPRARFLAATAVGVEPRIMGMGPVDATKRILNKTGLGLDDMAVIELNEAFAAQSLACLRELGLKNDDPRVNPNGGAIALGHPLGMSGARLLTTALIELENMGGRYGLCTMCVGVGQGMAAVIERV